MTPPTPDADPLPAGDLSGDRLVEFLSGASLFSEFHPEALEALAGRFSERAYARGDTIWHAGDEGSELLVVVSGELEVYGVSADGGQQLVGKIGRGECAGEMALVLDERRSASVTASRATRVLVLGKEDFREVIRHDSQVMASLTELLSRRAMALARRRPVTNTTITVGVAADPGVPGAGLVAAAVSGLSREVLGRKALLVRLGEEGLPLASLAHEAPPSTALRERGSLPPVLEVVPGADAGGRDLALAVDGILHAFGNRFGLIVIDVGEASGHGAAMAADACDFVIHVTAQLDPPEETRARVFHVVNRYRASLVPPPINACEPFILPVEQSLTAGWAPDQPLPLVDPALPLSRVLRRLVRKIGGISVGIALGGGAAFGIAHVGVLQALESAGLPVDLVSGTSMGSIVAVAYAAGMTPAELKEAAGRLGSVRTTLSAIDPSLSGVGLLNGKRMVTIFSPLLRRETFNDLDIPCQVVAMDIESGTAVTIGSGPLDLAFRTSSSIPIIFKPVRRDGQTLVDGGMIDPVPSGVVRDMGADIVIAVNVVPRLEPGVSTSLSRTFKRVNSLNPLSYLSGSRDMPDILDIFMNSMQVLQHELGNFKSYDSDVLINVDLGGFTWIDFHRAPAIVEQGRLAGERDIPAVRAALDARSGVRA